MVPSVGSHFVNPLLWNSLGVSLESSRGGPLCYLLWEVLSVGSHLGVVCFPLGGPLWVSIVFSTLNRPLQGVPYGRSLKGITLWDVHSRRFPLGSALEIPFGGFYGGTAWDVPPAGPSRGCPLGCPLCGVMSDVSPVEVSTGGVPSWGPLSGFRNGRSVLWGPFRVVATEMSPLEGHLCDVPSGMFPSGGPLW
jgi:hypothetical protein